MRWQELSNEELMKLPIKRLLNILKISRKSALATQRCGCCGEPWSYIEGEDSASAIRAKQSLEHYERIKSVCDKREHCET